MDNFQKLINRAMKNGYSLTIRYNPEEEGEEWAIRFYTNIDDNEYFYAYNVDLDNAARQLMDEMRGF